LEAAKADNPIRVSRRPIHGVATRMTEAPDVVSIAARCDANVGEFAVLLLEGRSRLREGS
jgi:hypothetical protein